MKILLSNKFFYPRGGDCIHMIDLKKLLEEQGHQVAIFTMNYKENLESEYAAYWPSEVSFGTKSPKKLFSAIFRPFGVSEVKNKWNSLLKSFQPDVVHLHNIHSQLSPVIAQEAKKHNIPVIWTLHDYKLLCPASAFLDVEGKVCEDCLQTKNSVVNKKCVKGSRFASWFGYQEAQKWNKEKLQQFTYSFISPSKFLKSKMEQGGYDSQKVAHIYNFADSAKFQHSIKQEREKEAIYVGRISIEKGVETLCKAFQKTRNAKLTIIGDGPLRVKLENKYASSNIEFIGFQPWRVIKDKLANASFLVIPSEWYENNPLTVIEALALGTPVLGANIAGIPELIQENDNGMIFSSGNVKHLIEQIQKMLTFSQWDYEKIQSDAKVKFSEDVYYSKLINLYNQAITDGTHK